MDEIGGGWHTAERAGRAGPGGLESHDGGCSSLSQEEDYKADPSSLQIIYPTKPDYVRDFWLSKAEKQFPLLAVAANKLLSAHATTAAAQRNWSAWGRTYDSLRNRLCIETAEKMVYVKANMPKQWYT